MPGTFSTPASTRAWQLAQRSTHLAASARILLMLRVRPCWLRFLGRWIQMMKLKRTGMGGETTDRARSSGLTDELSLDAPAPLGDIRRIAPLTPKAAIGASQKGGMPVPRTPQVGPLATGLPGCGAFSSSGRMVRFEATATQPIASRRVADPQLRCDLLIEAPFSASSRTRIGSTDSFGA